MQGEEILDSKQSIWKTFYNYFFASDMLASPGQALFIWPETNNTWNINLGEHWTTIFNFQKLIENLEYIKVHFKASSSRTSSKSLPLENSISVLFLQNLRFFLWLVIALQQSGYRRSRGLLYGIAFGLQPLPYFQWHLPFQSSQYPLRRPFKTEDSISKIGTSNSSVHVRNQECLWHKYKTTVWGQDCATVWENC